MGGIAKEVVVAKLSSHTGAEVLGVDLTHPLQPAVRERLYQAFIEHSVLVVRDQNLDAPQFLAAMQNFGEIFPQHNSRFSVPECPLVHYISNQDKLEDGRVYIPGEGYRYHPRQLRCTPSSCPRLAATRSSSTCTRPMTPCQRRRADGSRGA